MDVFKVTSSINYYEGNRTIYITCFFTNKWSREYTYFGMKLHF